MFISTLINSIDKYDKYGEHRINGIKTVYVLLVLFLFNLAFTIPNPYFNYFYITITAFSTEVTAITIADKYKQFLYTSLGAVISVFLFNMIVAYPLFFILFIFVYTLFLYLIALYYIRNLFPAVPIILSLAIYSLIYGQISTDFYIAFNNLMVTVFAVLIVLGALILFPLSYYYRAWLRAFRLLLLQIMHNLELINQDESQEVQLVQGHLVMMNKYAHLLPKKLPTFTILKINLLINDLRLLSCVANKSCMDMILRSNTILGLNNLISAIEHNTKSQTSTTYHNSLNKLIIAWNSLCLRV